MLYDPKWEKQAETKADPFALETLIAWLEKQPLARQYPYHRGGQCMLAQYFTANGLRNVHMFCDAFWHGDAPLPSWIGQDEGIKAGILTALPPLFNFVALMQPHTFGAALQRARKFAR
jgi:hypothetical protein